VKRTGYEILDIQKILVALLKANTSAPWSRWEVIHAWPADDVFDQITKPVIYIDLPDYAGDIKASGSLPGTQWECIVGLWDDNRTGGDEEIAVMKSQLLYFFRQKKDLHNKTFTVIIGGTTYTATDLLAQGLAIQAISPARTIDNDAVNNSFRVEYNLTIIS
jgi:hypothetical protein